MNDIIRKIRALLARADEDRNDNEHERAIAMRQATALMDKYNISEARLNEVEDPRGEDAMDTGAAMWRAQVIDAVARLYGCVCYRQADGRYTKTLVVGKLSHRMAALNIAEFAIDSIDREAGKYRGLSRGWLGSFRRGAAAGVHEQVRKIQAERARGETTSASKALVVVDHYEREREANNDWLEDQGVRLRKGGKSRTTDYGGYGAGKEYGRNVNLTGRVGQETRKLLA